MSSADARPTKNQKREEARDKARVLREANSKKSKRRKVLTQTGLAVGVVAVISIVTILIISSLRPPGPGPANMQSDGIKIGEGYQAVRTPALAADQEPVPSAENPEGVPAINIFIDYSCPACAQFEAANGPLLRSWLENGTVTVEYHILSFRDGQTAGTRYATRAGNSAACVAEHSPDSFFDFSELLLANQPAPPADFELSNSELIDIVRASGAENVAAIEVCIADENFANWLTDATRRAMTTGPLAVRNAEIARVTGTPAVFVNGKVLPPGGDLAAFVASFETSE